jgi:uncharacterized phage-associated protein
MFEVQPGLFAKLGGNPNNLDAKARETIDAVLRSYGHKDSFWLSELAHSEAAWQNARAGLQPGDRGSCEITPAAMAEYYGALVGVGQEVPPDGE